MAPVCQTCGDIGFEEALVHCDSCKIEAIHRYCIGITPTPITEYITWKCEDCDGNDSESCNIKVDQTSMLSESCNIEVDQTSKLTHILKKSDKKKKKKKKNNSNHTRPVLAEDHGIQDVTNVEPVVVSSSPITNTMESNSGADHSSGLSRVMASTKKPSVCEESNPPIVEAEEEMHPVDSEETELISQHSTDSDEEIEALKPLKMFFSPTEYMKPFKISAKCYIHQAVATLESHLSSDEMKWFREHPQFNHFFHMHRDPNHKLMAMWMLFLRTACLDKKKECWFIVNGVPIRYSLREHALISGLYCHSYPKYYERLGSLEFVGKHFGVGALIQYADVEKKLLSMKKASTDRLKMGVLYFLSSVIIGKRKTGKNAPSVEKFFLRAVDDLELCKTFPWGRLAFDENMKDIFHLMDHFRGVVGGSAVFPSFVIPLELLAFEAIPVLMNNFRENVRQASPECPRMCKMKLKYSSLKGFPISDVYNKLGTTKDIQSIMAPSFDEKVLLAKIMDDEVGMNDEDDGVVDGWTKRLIVEKKTIWFKDLYNQDVASREIKANPGTENANVVPEKVARHNVAPKKVARRNVAPKNVSIDGLLEALNRLKKALNDLFKKINEKIDALETRVRSLETSLKSLDGSKHM